MSEVIDPKDVERLCKKYFFEKAYVYIRRRHGNLFRHSNGKILSYSPDEKEISFKDDLFAEPIKIAKSDILFIDYSRRARHGE